jgi:hypothetical protein
MAAARAGSWDFHPQLDRSSSQGGFTRQDMRKVTAQRWPILIKRGDGIEPFNEADAARARYLTVAEAERLVDNSAPDFRQLVQAALVTQARYAPRAVICALSSLVSASGSAKTLPAPAGSIADKHSHAGSTASSPDGNGSLT